MKAQTREVVIVAAATENCKRQLQQPNTKQSPKVTKKTKIMERTATTQHL